MGCNRKPAVIEFARDVSLQIAQKSIQKSTRDIQ
jgi:hypothetical protein